MDTMEPLFKDTPEMRTSPYSDCLTCLHLGVSLRFSPWLAEKCELLFRAYLATT